MADAQESTGQESSGPLLGQADILGVVQRTASDLHSYCAQPPHMVDRNVCLAMLEHAAHYLGWLAPLHAPADAPEQRAH